MLVARTFFDQIGKSLDDYVRHLVQYQMPDKNGITKNAHMLKIRSQMEKAGKSAEVLDVQFAELTPPEVSGAGKYLLMMFLELNSARQQGMNGPMPISYVELKAYSELTDAELEPWEVDAIRLCDRAYIEEVAVVQNKE